MNQRIEMAQSVEQLTEISELEEPLLREVKRKDCKTIFKSVQKVMMEAEAAMTRRDQKNAYVYYMRAAALCMVIHSKKDKGSFSKSDEEQQYLQFFKNVMENAEDLKKKLEIYYQDRQLAIELNKAHITNEVIIPIKVEQKKPEVLEEVFATLITAKQLVDMAWKSHRILIIDYREKTDVQINFKNNEVGSNIVVALCPPQLIESNITLVDLSKVMPIMERQKLDKKEMEKYDFVVFMDDDDPKKGNKEELLPPANHLWKGLTTYAYDIRLKREPLFLKGGFKMWSRIYGTYTNIECNNSLFSEDYGRMLSEFKQNVDVF